MLTSIAISAISLFSISPAYAITATPSATPTVTVTPSDNQVNSNLQDRIRNMVQQNVSTTEAKLKEKLNELSLVGYAGKVTAVANSNLNLS